MRTPDRVRWCDCHALGAERDGGLPPPFPSLQMLKRAVFAMLLGSFMASSLPSALLPMLAPFVCIDCSQHAVSS